MSGGEQRDRPLDPALQALLDEERQRSGAAPEADARLWLRLEASLDWIDAQPAGSPAPTRLEPRRASPASAPRRWRRRLLVAAMILGACSFGAAARELYARARSRSAPPPAPAPAPRPPAAASPAPVPPPAPPAPPEPLPELLPATPAPPPAPPGAPHAVRAPAPAAAVAVPPRERQLLEMARTALGLQRLAEAERALAQHRQDFPHGRLAEERESLAVQLLFAQGRREAARAAAARFHASYPHAISWTALQRLLDESAPAPERE